MFIDVEHQRLSLQLKICFVLFKFVLRGLQLGISAPFLSQELCYKYNIVQHNYGLDS